MESLLPFVSFCDILNGCASLSGYRVNQEKSVIMGMYIDLDFKCIIRHDRWMEPPCPEMICIWISIGGAATVGKGYCLHALHVWLSKSI